MTMRRMNPTSVSLCAVALLLALLAPVSLGQVGFQGTAPDWYKPKPYKPWNDHHHHDHHDHHSEHSKWELHKGEETKKETKKILPRYGPPVIHVPYVQPYAPAVKVVEYAYSRPAPAHHHKPEPEHKKHEPEHKKHEPEHKKHEPEHKKHEPQPGPGYYPGRITHGASGRRPVGSGPDVQTRARPNNAGQLNAIRDVLCSYPVGHPCGCKCAPGWVCHSYGCQPGWTIGK
ncbi:hypothetical protein HOP50_13g71010 [Chloropicon primus]|nr:hypothetical protein HOP50_13g71010 [Chloropicon primus]